MVGGAPGAGVRGAGAPPASSYCCRRDQDLVDDVDDAVRGHHVGLCHQGAADVDLGAGHADGERGSFERLRRREHRGLCRGDLALDDVVEEDGLQLRLVLAECGQRRLRHLGEGRVGGSEHGQRALPGQGADEAGLLDERDEGLELAGGDRRLDDVLLAHGCRLRGRGRRDRGGGCECRGSDHDCCS